MPEQPRNRLTDMIEEELAPLELDHWEPEWNKLKKQLEGLLEALEKWTSSQTDVIFFNGDRNARSWWAFLGDHVAIADLEHAGARKFHVQIYDRRRDFRELCVDTDKWAIEHLHDPFSSVACVSVVVSTSSGKGHTLKAEGERCRKLLEILRKYLIQSAESSRTA